MSNERRFAKVEGGIVTHICIATDTVENRIELLNNEIGLGDHYDGIQFSKPPLTPDEQEALRIKTIKGHAQAEIFAVASGGKTGIDGLIAQINALAEGFILLEPLLVNLPAENQARATQLLDAAKFARAVRAKSNEAEADQSKPTAADVTWPTRPS